MTAGPAANRRWMDKELGWGQLTLVEHSLCPLDPRASLVENLVHEASYFFMNAQRRWRKSNAVISCPLGLSANDELYLWGLRVHQSRSFEVAR